jgi:hypothetical protein
MSRVVSIASLCYLLSGCSALDRVEVVDAPPQQCKLLEELSFHRACDHEGRIVPEDLTDFKRLALKIGADTIQCCRVAEDEVVLLGTNPRTGQMCTGARQRFASAYLCGKGSP